MKVVVTDACIFIDILELGISSNFFELDLEIHTTYEVWDELYKDQKEILNAYRSVDRLTIHILEPNDFAEISNAQFPNALSTPDQTVLHIARKLDAILLSSDGKVRKYAQITKIKTHGIFWIFDELVKYEVLTKDQANNLLKKLFKSNLMYKNNRKLRQEANKRLKEWGEEFP